MNFAPTSACMPEGFQKLNRAHFESFWSNARTGRLAWRAPVCYVALTALLGAAIISLLWHPQWDWLFLAVSGGYLAAIHMVFRSTLTQTERRFLKCPCCHRVLTADDTQQMLASSICRHCKAEVLE